MARPKNDKKQRKAELELLDERTLYRVIKNHDEVKQYDLTMEQVRAVFRAFANITYNSLLMNYRVTLPHLGEFYPQKMKGYQGGMVKKFDEPFKKGSATHEEYVPPKPDYKIMQFDFIGRVSSQFKDETREKEVR